MDHCGRYARKHKATFSPFINWVSQIAILE
jgi:hypothetical protein